MDNFVKQVLASYNDEQRDAIRKAAEEAVSTKEGFEIIYTRTMDIRRYRETEQQFAVFGWIARQLPKIGEIFRSEYAPHRAVEYLPAFTEAGEAISEEPEEGRSGVLCLYRMIEPKVRPWVAGYIDLGWLRAEELQQTPEEIRNNIAEDLDAGRISAVRQ